MPARGHRQNRAVLRFARVVVFGLVTWFALSALFFRPTGVALGVAVIVGAVAYFSPEVATLAFVLAASLPLIAANAILGVAFLIIGVAAVQYFGGDGGAVFAVVASAFVLAWLGPLGPVWAVPVVAGYVLGGSRGAMASIVACLVIQVAGLVFGHPVYGLVQTGGSETAILVLSAKTAPQNLLSLSWVGPAVRSISGESATQLFSQLTKVRSVGFFIFQPIVWGLGAAMAARLRRPSSDPRQLVWGIGAAVAGVAVLALGTIAGFAIFGLPREYAGFAPQAAISTITAAIVIVIADRIFKFVPPAAAQPASGAAALTGTMAVDDADVDELLRMIATAEEKIATEHTQDAVVMITDMKSFSKMTEEEGSVVTAKAIQRHRDLLIPVIESNHGRGKSTGGDGLVASFATPDDALRAAAAMQCTLDKHNLARPHERDITIRVGIASGEVVLDKGGRPFIGAGLNLAARVMSLGDGGQIMVTRQVIEAGGLANVKSHSHGEFSLKNIAEPVEVFEVLWRDGQDPRDPRGMQGRPEEPAY